MHNRKVESFESTETTQELHRLDHTQILKDLQLTQFVGNRVRITLRHTYPRCEITAEKGQGHEGSPYRSKLLSMATVEIRKLLVIL